MKNLKNLGKALSKTEQKEVNGGKLLASCSDLYNHIDCISPDSGLSPGHPCYAEICE